FTCIRLHYSYLPGSSPGFSLTLTTTALYCSSSRWFEACSYSTRLRGASPHPLYSLGVPSPVRSTQWQILTKPNKVVFGVLS
ncbi:MAG: hypothetical protein ABIQ95_06460, partial [Bdellovibrionia bacterium]